VKRTISTRADGAICIGREAVPVGVFFFIKNCTSAVPHNITLFAELLFQKAFVVCLLTKGLRSFQ